MGFLRINRKGKVITRLVSSNQCKGPGHHEYAYHVSMVCCDTNLDKRKFVIDHVSLHQAIDRIFKLRISSCEEMILIVRDRLDKLAKRHKIQVVDLYIRLTPVLTEDTDPDTAAFMEYSHTGKFI